MADSPPNGHPSDAPESHTTSSSPAISWPLNRPEHRTPWSSENQPSSPSSAANGHFPTSAPPPAYAPSQSNPIYSIQPSGAHSLSAISSRAFLLGCTLGISITLTLYLAISAHSPLWRAPFFIASLALFHFLEFWVTARYNSPLATTKAFLLASNGWAYQVAHGLALIETSLTHGPFASRNVADSTRGSFYATWLPGLDLSAMVAIGLAMMLVGQLSRSVAMAEAGSNFNHVVQMQRNRGHELVTTGIYGVLRHPSYFGFWWWGLGTQVVLGNAVCFVGYAVVLWRFFKTRIEREEELLVKFFGDDYVRYKQQTRVAIPFIP